MPACRDARNGALRSMKCRAAKTRFHGTTTTRGTGAGQQQEERWREFARAPTSAMRRNQRKFAKRAFTMNRGLGNGLRRRARMRAPKVRRAPRLRVDADNEASTTPAIRRSSQPAACRAVLGRPPFPPRRWVSGRRLKATSEPQRTALCYLLLFPWIDRPPGPSSMCTPSG